MFRFFARKAGSSTLASLAVLLAGCTGLTAGPQVAAVTPVPASRDSAWVRAKRALTAEVFTVDVQDSLTGHLTAMRYPSATAKVGTAAACRVQLALTLEGSGDQTSLASNSRWIAPTVSQDSNAKVCDQERQETLDRIVAVVAPPPAP
jgi:hypothetical protein